MQVDLGGKLLVPGFIDSHEHALDGGDGLTHANTFDEVLLGDSLARFVDDNVQSGKAVVDGFVIIDGINISTWSHLDQLDELFNNGKYAGMPVLMRGSDGHTGWANKIILNKAGLNRIYISSLNDERRKYFGYDQSHAKRFFLQTAVLTKSTPYCPILK